MGAVEEDEEIDPDSSAQVTFLMKDLLGGEDTLYKRGVALFEQYLDQMSQNSEQGFYYLKGEKRENEVYHLTHLLGQSIFSGKRGASAGYNVRNAKAKKILEGILSIQREDGGFRPYWSQESDPLYTGIVLKIFLWAKAMEKDQIKSTVEKVVFPAT